jgi:hypothetical protein
MKKQLLCTFSKLDEYEKLLDIIKNYYPISNNKLFLFSNVKDQNIIYITYNIEINDNKNFSKFRDTIGLHRKKETCTLYTLNAMNKLITEENGGIFDNTYQLNWNLYSNCLILTGEVSVRIIPIKLFNIIS